MRLFFGVLISCFFPVLLAGQKSFPSAQEVVQHFHDEYGFGAMEAWRYNLEKHLDGYYLIEYDEARYPAIAKRALIWSAASGNWAPLPRPKQADADGEVVQIQIDTFYLNHMPCFGYVDWYFDAIPYLEKKEKKDAASLFALGYAWDQRSGGMVGRAGIYTYETPKEAFPVKKIGDGLTKPQLDSFLWARKKAIDYFGQLAKLAPDFPTIVGPASVKYANEYMATYLDLQLIQNQQVALEYAQTVPDNIYNPFLLETGRNYLRSCPKNAVILTYGDNDTYPLQYVQVKEKLRTDVRILSLSYMILGRYINTLRKPCLDSAPLQLSLSENYYVLDSTDRSKAVEVELESQLPPKSLFSQLESGKIRMANRTIETPASSVVWQVDNSANHTGATNVEVKLSFLELNTYLDQIALLDLIYNNVPKRPVCFSMGCDAKSLRFFTNHLEIEGLVKRFIPEEIPPNCDDLQAYLNPDKNEVYLREVLKIDTSLKITEDGVPTYYLYSILPIVSAEIYQTQGNTEKALAMLDWFRANTGNERMLWGSFGTYVGNMYVELGKNDIALAMLRQMLDDLDAGLYTQKYGADYLPIVGKYVRYLANKVGDQTQIERAAKY